MIIDRTKALLLVGMLASTSACVVASDDDEDSSGGTAGEGGSSGSQSGGTAGEAGSSTTGGSGGTAGGSTTGGAAGTGAMSAGGAGATGGAATGGAGGATGGAGGATGGAGGSTGGAATGGAGGATGGAGGATGGTGGATGGTGGAMTCDDSVGNVVDCSAAQCSVSDTFAEDVCNTVKGRAKPAVAEKIGNCILGLDSGQRCNFASDVYTCVEAGLLQSCPDASAATACGTITGTCNTIDSATCEVYLSGVEDSYRADFVSCMQSFCDFYTCSESMSF